MSEYSKFYDKNDELLIQINTTSNKEQNQKNYNFYNIEIHYCNFYNTEKQNITGCIQCAAIILDYEKFINNINSNLYEHYNNFKLYAKLKDF